MQTTCRPAIRKVPQNLTMAVTWRKKNDRVSFSTTSCVVSSVVSSAGALGRVAPGSDAFIGVTVSSSADILVTGGIFRPVDLFAASVNVCKIPDRRVWNHINGSVLRKRHVCMTRVC